MNYPCKQVTDRDLLLRDRIYWLDVSKRSFVSAATSGHLNKNGCTATPTIGFLVPLFDDVHEEGKGRWGAVTLADSGIFYRRELAYSLASWKKKLLFMRTCPWVCMAQCACVFARTAGATVRVPMRFRCALLIPRMRHPPVPLSACALDCVLIWVHAHARLYTLCTRATTSRHAKRTRARKDADANRTLIRTCMCERRGFFAYRSFPHKQTETRPGTHMKRVRAQVLTRDT